MTANGFAYVVDDIIAINTVHNTHLGACVNTLVTVFGVRVMHGMNDEYLQTQATMLAVRAGGAILPVEITVKKMH